jgi:hypothetical protein
MPSSHLNDPEHWRDRSKEERAMAEGMADSVSKQKMLERIRSWCEDNTSNASHNPQIRIFQPTPLKRGASALSQQLSGRNVRGIIRPQDLASQALSRSVKKAKRTVQSYPFR